MIYMMIVIICSNIFFQAEDGIRDTSVTGVQTCALPISPEGKRAFCFYPMSKRRGEGDNWFSLPYDERERLMHGHGAVGRTFAGRVLQLVTGSTGLDEIGRASCRERGEVGGGTVIWKGQR